MKFIILLLKILSFQSFRQGNRGIEEGIIKKKKKNMREKEKSTRKKDIEFYDEIIL